MSREARRALDDYARALQGKPSRAKQQAAVLVGCAAFLFKALVLFVVIYAAIRLGTR